MEEGIKYVRSLVASMVDSNDFSDAVATKRFVEGLSNLVEDLQLENIDLESRVECLEEQVECLEEELQTVEDGDFGRCESCRHWSRNGMQEYGSTVGASIGLVSVRLDLGRCMWVPLFWEATEGGTETSGRVVLEEYKDRKAFAQDAEDFCAFLITRPDFGCVSHDPADGESPFQQDQDES